MTDLEATRDFRIQTFRWGIAWGLEQACRLILNDAEKDALHYRLALLLHDTAAAVSRGERPDLEPTHD